MRTTLVAFILLLVFNTNVSAQFGMVDNSFGVDGKVITNIDYITGGSCVAVQKNGRILAGTAYLDFYDEYDFYLTRFYTNGLIDDHFGNNGSSISHFGGDGYYPSDIAMQKDGKILMIGLYRYYANAYPTIYSHFTLARYKTDGLLDSSFGGFNHYGYLTSENNPNFEGTPAKVLELPDTKILVGGIANERISDDYSTFTYPRYLCAVRYNSDGSPDSSFGKYGLSKIDLGENIHASGGEMVVLQDGSILLGGTLQSQNFPLTFSDLVLAKMTSDGKPDSSFGNNGVIITDLDNALDELSSILLLENNKMIVTANFSHGTNINPSLDSIAVLRYNSNGTIDSSFGKKGRITLAYNNKPGSNSTSSVLLPGGKIIIGGYSYNDSSFLLIALNKNGSIDSSFGNNGFTITSVKTGDGTGNNGSNYAEQLFGYDMDIAPDGKIVLVGTYKYKRGLDEYRQMVIARYFGETVLPITLSSFTATKKQSSVLLNWQTTNETNNSYFSLERSNNNNDGFKEIARVNSKGNSSQTQQYSYEDVTPLNGNNYCRLKQFDKNGNVTTSKIILVELSNKNIRIYPNPAFAVLNIEGLQQGTKTTLTILNANGAVVAKTNINNANYSFNIRSLPAGSYFLKIKNEDVEVVKLFIKR